MNTRYTGILLAVLTATLSATEARTESMGKSSRFMRDDMAVLTNPAWMLLYPRLLTGSMGEISGNSLTGQWFGGWVGFSPGVVGHTAAVGAAFNRRDDLEKTLMAYGPLKNVTDLGQYHYQVIDSSGRLDTVTDTSTARYVSHPGFRYDTVDITVPEPVGHTDLFLGYTMGELGLGAHVYVAYQDSVINGENIASSGVVKGDLGMLYRLDETDLIDISLFLARITYFRKSTSTPVDEAKFSLGFNARSFLTLAGIGGQVVPALKFSRLALVQDTIMTVGSGIGYTRELGDGMFWGGLEYEFTNARKKELSVRDTTISHSVIFGFGIEKQIIWNWFVLRVGGRKVIRFNEYRSSSRSTTRDMTTNPYNSATAEDLVGAGIGLYAGGRLKFDITANERLPFMNPLYGDLENVVTRVCATYAF